MSSESTSELSTTESEGLFPASSKHHNHLHFSSATRKILRRGHDLAVRKRGGKEKDSEIMESLNSIGSQLGVLISKMDTPSHTPTHTFHPPPLPASLAPLPPDLSMTNPRLVNHPPNGFVYCVHMPTPDSKPSNQLNVLQVAHRCGNKTSDSLCKLFTI